MADDPLALFDAWYAEAKSVEINDPHAMALATCSADGQPSVRMVLLKGHGREGFTFYTNADSRKGEDLAANPEGAVQLHWKSLRRQVTSEGPVEEVSSEQADAYFATRGRDSQIGAWASDQSRPLDRREAFEARCEEVRARFEGKDVPRPPRWTGYRIFPLLIEFWTDRPHRLHERRQFRRHIGGSWSERLLYP